VSPRWPTARSSSRRRQKGNNAAVLHFSQSQDVEEIHAKLYKEAMNHFMEERETTLLCLQDLRLCVGRPSSG